MGVLKHLRWLAYAGFLFGAYTAFLPSQGDRLPDGVLTIFQAHRVAGEDFLLRKDRPDALLVGSSLSAVLPQIGLGPVQNLALSGGSAITGLRLIAASGKLPRILFIEANVLDRPADETLLAELLNPISRQVKEWCDVCRTRNQPITVALSRLSNWRLAPLSASEEDKANMAIVRSPESVERMLAVQLEASKNAIDSATLQPVLGQLTSVIDSIRRSGVKVVFVELPIHPALAATPMHRSVLSVVKATFPEPDNQWLVFRGSEYATSDGAHLTYRSAKAVGVRIAQEARLGGRPADVRNASSR